MKITLSESAMLEKWCLLRAAEPLRLDCTLERTDGTDLTAIYKAEMRAWYLRLLDSGPEQFLAPADVSAQATVAFQGKLVVITAPEDVRRILSLEFSGNCGPLLPTASPERVRTLADNPYWHRPLVARINARTVIACGLSGTLQTLRCAVDHGPQAYVFDDSALDFFPSNPINS